MTVFLLSKIWIFFQFSKMNGYANTFYGWGGEDDDLHHRMQQQNFSIFRSSPIISRFYMQFHGPVRVLLLFCCFVAASSNATTKFLHLSELAYFLKILYAVSWACMYRYWQLYLFCCCICWPSSSNIFTINFSQLRTTILKIWCFSCFFFIPSQFLKFISVDQERLSWEFIIAFAFSSDHQNLII